MTPKQPPLLGQLIRAMTLAIGFGAIWFVLVNLIGEEIVHAIAGPENDWPPREEIVVRSDGTPLIKSSSRGLTSTTYRTLDGRAVTGVEDRELVQPIWMAASLPESEGLIFLLSSDSRSGWEHRLRLFVDDQRRNLKWFFIHDGKREGTGYFVAYDQVSKRRAGFIGQSGFSSDSKPPSDPFPVRSDLMRPVSTWSSAGLHLVRGTVQDLGPVTTDTPSHLVYVPSEKRVVVVDLSTGLVRTVLETPEPITSLVILGAPSEAEAEQLDHGILLVRTTHKIYKIGREHALLRTFVIPSELEDRPASWYELENGQAIAEFYLPWIGHDNKNIGPKAVYRISADGTIAERAELPLQSGMLKWHKQHSATLFRWALPMPGILPLIEPFMVMFIDQEPTYASAAQSMVRNSWLSLAGIMVLSSLLAVATWRRSRAFRLSKPEQVTWVLFVLLFGLPGYIGYLLHRRWPLRQACPHCRARVPWNRSACAACRRQFPAPASKGIEIFC